MLWCHLYMHSSVDFHGIRKTLFHVHNGLNNNKLCHISYFNKHLFPLLLLTMKATNFKIGVQQITMKPQYLFYKERTTYSTGN